MDLFDNNDNFKIDEPLMKSVLNNFQKKTCYILMYNIISI